MSKISFLLLVLIVSCDQQWNVSETDNFLNRCKQQRPLNLSIDPTSYDNFCICLESQSQKINASYQDFLKQKLSESDLDKIINSCINE